MMKKHSIRSLSDMKSSGEKISWLTCYDYSFASVLEATSLDMILVGDSGGMVLLGYKDTIPVSMEEMIFMCKAVRRGAPNKFIVGDMPKGSYEFSDLQAQENAMRFVKEANCDAVKLEGGASMAPRVEAIQKSGVPVIGHIGLTPQTSAQFGGYRVVGKNRSEVDELLNSAYALEKAGAFGVLLEATPSNVSEELTKKLSMITLGIGAGPLVDGQLLILHDLLGLYPDFRPKFAKCYVPEILREFSSFLDSSENLINLGRHSREDGLRKLSLMAVQRFIDEVKNNSFPSEEYVY